MQRCIIGRSQVYIQSNVNKWSRLAGFKDIKSSVCVTVVISSHMLLTAHCSLDHLSILGDQLHPSWTRAPPALIHQLLCCFHTDVCKTCAYTVLFLWGHTSLQSSVLLFAGNHWNNLMAASYVNVELCPLWWTPAEGFTLALNLALTSGGAAITHLLPKWF